MHPAAALLVLLALTQAVISSFFAVNFSQVQQCGSFQVNFTGVPGTTPPALPVTLTIVPFSSNPILIPIPIGAWDNSTFKGAAEITFLPFDGGTQFVASLDDANGQGMGLVSDVIGVQPSSDSTCLPMARNDNDNNDNNKHGGGGNKGAKTDFYDFKGDFEQCTTFNVTFDPTLILQPPSIRAFLPRSFSFPVNATMNSPMPGNQEYMLDVFHGFQAVLLLDDGAGHSETSGLFTAGGDASSSTHCFPFIAPNQTAQVSATDTTSRTSAMSKNAKIIVAISCVTVVLIVAIIMAFIIKRKRARSRQLRSASSSTKSFVFTEDVDMGSTFIGRMRGQLSQFLGSNFSLSGEKRSYRSYRYDEKSEMPSSYEDSYGIPTSPRGSLIPPKSRPVSEGIDTSWVDIERMLDENYFKKASWAVFPFVASSIYKPAAVGQQNRAVNPPFPLPIINPPLAARLRGSAPDAPSSVFPRSPSTQYKYGSVFGIGSSSSSRTASLLSVDRQRRTSGSGFENSDVRQLRIDLSTSHFSLEDLSSDRLSDGVRKYTPMNSTMNSARPSVASSLRSSQFAFNLPQTRASGVRVNAARVSPFPTSPISSLRSSRTSR